jgi:hypothetical protein
MTTEAEPASRKVARTLLDAVEDQTPEFVVRLLRSNPEVWNIYHNDDLFSRFPLIYRAAQEQKQPKQRNEMIKLLLCYGADINAQENGSTPLVIAVQNMDKDFFRFLIDHGADPNRSYLFHRVVLNHKDTLEFGKLLLDCGTDVNFLDEGRNVTALDWIAPQDPKLGAYLISRGAKYAEQILGPDTKGVKPIPTKTLESKIDNYFSSVFGPVAKKSIQSIVPSPQGIDVHWVPSGSKRGIFKKPHPSTVLFTNGLSRNPLAVPMGADDFRYAELVTQLPSTWPDIEIALKDERTAWPILWLRQIAEQVIATGDWLGDVATVIANEDLKPLGPGCSFVAWLVYVRHEIRINRKMRVVLYSCMPIYREEYALERKHGIAFLAEKLVRGAAPDAIDLNRPNLGLSEK